MSYKATGSQPLSVDACDISPELATVQSLMPISAEDKQELKESIERDGIREPIRGYFDKEGGKFLILSGFNRWQIARELNLQTIPVQAVEIKDREAYAVDENRARRHLTLDDKRRLAAWLLKRSPETSNRTAARFAGIDHKTINNVRGGLERRGEIPHAEKRIDTKGRKQASNRHKPSGNSHSDRTGKAHKGATGHGRGQGKGNEEAALRAFNSALNDALKKVEMQPAAVLKIAVRYAKSWLKDVERKQRSAEAIGK